MGHDHVKRVAVVDFACSYLYFIRFLVPAPLRQLIPYRVPEPTLTESEPESECSGCMADERIYPEIDVTWGDLERHDRLVREFPTNFGFD